MGCFGTYFTHAQSCDNVRVQRATEWTASVNTLHMPKSVITFVFIMLRNTCPNLSCDNAFKVLRNGAASVHTSHMPKGGKTFVFKVLRNGLLRYILYTCPKHPKAVISFVSKVLRNGLLRYITYTAQSCDNVRVQSATEWTASVHTLHMPKAVITFVFKVLRNGLLRCKTRQLENENTFCCFRVFAFPSFCVFPISVRL